VETAEQVTELSLPPAGEGADVPPTATLGSRARLHPVRDVGPAAGYADAPDRESVTQPVDEVIAPVQRDATWRRMLALADVIAATIGLLVLERVVGTRSDVTWLIALPLIVVLAKLMGRYDHDDMMLRRSTLDEAPLLLALAAMWCLVWSMISLTDRAPKLAGGGIAILWLVTGVMLIFGRTAARLLAKRMTGCERVLIVGSSHARERLAQSLSTDPGARIAIVGFLPLEDERRPDPTADWGHRSRRKLRRTFDDLARVVHEMSVDRVFLIPTSADSETMLEAVTRTTAIGVNVSIVPRLFEVVGSAVEFDTVGGVTVLGVRRIGLGRSSRAVKRAMDVVGAGFGLLLLSPLFALLALAIKLDSRGTVFFRQARVGRDGRHFGMFKFRSMVNGAEAQRAALESRNETDGLFKLRDDPRVTRVGRYLRRASVDEIPQLINVLLGDMSLVGPRPLVIDEDRLVEGRHRARLRLAPGMTGPWQVLGPLRPPLSEMVKTDYLYAANWSLWTDIKIVLRTICHVLAQRGL
jgi:exopolysaccharide biosynthesis polyprenyl glycosylphosphotransferase